MPVEKQSQLNLPRVKSASLPRFFLPLSGSVGNNHELLMPECRPQLSARAIYAQPISRITRKTPAISNLREYVKTKDRVQVAVEAPMSTSLKPPLAPRRSVISETPTTVVPRLSFQPIMQIPTYRIVFGYEDSRKVIAQMNVPMRSARDTNSGESPPLRRR